jgi:membrane-associated protein
VGALIWAVGITMLGYALGEELGLDKDENIDKLLLPMVLGIILVSLIPVALEWRKSRRIKADPLAPAAAKAEAEELSEILDDD